MPGFPEGTSGKDLACQYVRLKTFGFNPNWIQSSGSRRFPGGGNGSPFQYSCLENPMDRGAWQVTVYEVAKSQT